MFLLRLITTLIFFGVLFCQSAFCAVNYKVKELVLDNSDSIVVIKGQGNFKLAQDDVYAPLPSANGSINIINDIALHSVTNPARYVIDIPGSVLIGANRTYKIKNSKTLQSVALSQFSTNPHIVRVVFTLKNYSDLEKFKTYTDGENIIVKYSPTVVKNVFQYKFYTPAGDTSARANLQNLSAQIVYNNSQDPQNIEPKFQTKYYLTQISQNSDGLILRGLGQISMERVKYNPEGTMASLNLDSCALSMKYDGKTFKIPSSNPDLKATLTIDKLNSKKVKLTLLGENLRDYRFVVAPDGQSLFISHRTYVINTFFTSRTAKVNSYKFEKNANGYSVFDLAFNMPVTYDVFELNNSFYLDVNNLSDYNEELLKEVLAQAGVEITAYKISSDKTRFIVPLKNISFTYANVESNAKSIKLCFKDNDIQTPVAEKKEEKQDSINVVYIPKQETPEVKEPKKKKETPKVISSLKKVVIDAGHGGIDSGAIGGGHYEKTINLNIAKMVQEKLAKKDVYVHMTRTKDATMSLEERVEFSNELNPDIFVSIHTNSTLNLETQGLETHYFKDNSIDLADIIHKNFASEKNLRKWDTKDRGVIKSRFYVINHTEAPSVLIEIGFISNDEERAKIVKKDRQEEIATAIAKGILEYLKIKW